MNVLLISPQPFFEERGTPIAVYHMAKALSDCGHEVDLLAYHCGRDLDMPGVKITRAARPPGVDRVPIGISWQKLACDAMLGRRLMQMLDGKPYDVIHAVEESVLVAAVLKRRTHVRLVYDMDSLLSEQLLQKWTALRSLTRVLVKIEQFAVRRCDVVLAVCDELAEDVRRMDPAANVRVITDVPLPASQVLAAEVDRLRDIVGADGPLALYVGNLEHYQGVDELVQGMHRIPEAAALSLVIVGGQPDHIARCRAKVPPRCRDRVHFLGPRPLAHLYALMSQADILVSPRLLGRNTPMKIYSYMQAGKPILATSIRSHTQVLDESCALLVEATAQALGEGLARLALDEEMRLALGACAAQRVAERHSPEAFQRIVAETYQSLCPDAVIGAAAPASHSRAAAPVR